MTNQSVLPRNDPRQYDELVGAWWDPRGPLATLQWIAEARARLIPPVTNLTATRPTRSTVPEVLLDVACGAGLLAPHVAHKGYKHVGVDLTGSALSVASDHGVCVVQGDVLALPFDDGCASVVCAGEILEHVGDLNSAVAETCRVLRPGGLLVLDTIANTALARFLVVSVAERIRGGAPPGIHDPALFVDRQQLVAAYARHGVQLRLRGLRPSLTATLAWRVGLRRHGRMMPTKLTTVLFQAWGIKDAQ